MKAGRCDLITRRRFTTVLAAAAATCARAGAAENSSTTTSASSQPATSSAASAAGDQQIIDAGPIDKFKEQTVFDEFRTRGFFLIHRDKQLIALSSTCTHKGCTVRIADDHSFYCKCHGSRFSVEGTVTHAPAVKDLPHLAVALNEDRHVVVNLDRIVGE